MINIKKLENKLQQKAFPSARKKVLKKKLKSKIKMAKLYRMNIPTPYGYKYYSSFESPMGMYIIWSRDGKRYYLDGGNNAELLMLPDTPFKNPTSAKGYIMKRIRLKDKFGVKVKH